VAALPMVCCNPNTDGSDIGDVSNGFNSDACEEGVTAVAGVRCVVGDGIALEWRRRCRCINTLLEIMASRIDYSDERLPFAMTNVPNLRRLVDVKISPFC
jgi:hypothetical protein